MEKEKELLNQYMLTNMTPEEVLQMKAQLEAYNRGEMMQIPEFKPGDFAYIVIDDFNFMHPHISECRVTGYDWTREEGFSLNVEATKRDQGDAFSKNVLFANVDRTLFKTCADAGRRVDQLMNERGGLEENENDKGGLRFITGD